MQKFPKPAVTFGLQFRAINHEPNAWLGGVFSADGVGWAPAGAGRQLVFFNGTSWIRLDTIQTTIQVNGDAAAAGNFNLVAGDGITITQDDEDVTISLTSLSGGGSGSANYGVLIEDLTGPALAVTTTDVFLTSVSQQVNPSTEGAFLEIQGNVTAGADDLDLEFTLQSTGGLIVSSQIMVMARDALSGGAWSSANTDGTVRIPAGETWAVRVSAHAVVTGTDAILSLLGSKVTLDTSAGLSFFRKSRARAWLQ